MIDLAELTEKGVERSLAVPGDKNWHVYGLVAKYNGPEADARAAAGGAPDAYSESINNLLTTAGLNRMTSLITGAGGQAATNTATRIGVGDTATAAAVGQTDLSAAANAANRQFEIMAATYPTQANGVITARAVFSTGEANFAWNEWCIDIGTPAVAAGIVVSAVMLNRKVTSLGTKTSAAAWTFTVTITIT